MTNEDCRMMEVASLRHLEFSFKSIKFRHSSFVNNHSKRGGYDAWISGKS